MLRSQRPQGRYNKPFGTKTVFGLHDNLATGLHAAQAAADENAFGSTAGGSTTDASGNFAGGASGFAFIHTSAAGFPNDAAWPTGTYRCQYDVTAAGAGMSYGLRTAGTAVGHFARVASDLSSELETKQDAQPLFTGTGTKLATTGSVSWSAGAVGDRFECALAATRAASSGNQTVTLRDSSDFFADGPWLAFKTYDETVVITAVITPTVQDVRLLSEILQAVPIVLSPAVADQRILTEVVQAVLTVRANFAKIAASDPFIRANSDTLGVPWVEKETDGDPGNTFKIQGNAVFITTGSGIFGFAYYNQTFLPDHFAQLTWKARTNNPLTGPAVRVDSAGTTSSATFYVALYDKFNNRVELRKYVAQNVTGVGTTLGVPFSVTLVDGDIVRIEVHGSTLRVLVNGIERITAVDQAIASGRPGLASVDSGFGGDNTWNNWVAGEFDAVQDVAVFVDKQQVGIIVVVPTVTDTFIGAGGGEVFNETVTVISEIIASVLDQMVGVERPSITVIFTPAALGLQTMVDRPAVSAVIVPAVLGLQTMVDKPGVGLVLTTQETDTAVLVERPAFVAALQAVVSDVASLIDRPLNVVVVSPAVSDKMTATDVALATLALVPQALSVAVFQDGPQVGVIVVLPAVTDNLVGGPETFNEVVTIVETIVASVLDRLVGVDQPSVTVAISPAVLGLQTMQEKPGVGAVLVIQEQDTTLLVDRPSVTLGVLAGERDWRILTERPAVTAAVQPSVRDAVSMVETASVIFALVPQAVSVAVLRDNPQVGVVILLPGVTDTFIGAEGPQTINETVTIIETIIASVSDQLVATDRPVVLVTLIPSEVDELTEFLAGRLGGRIVVVDPSGRIYRITTGGGRTTVVGKRR
jgi:putative Mn2+ efflux pump MntP